MTVAFEVVAEAEVAVDVDDQSGEDTATGIVVIEPELQPGDTVRVSDVAVDSRGYNVPNTLRGQLGTLDFHDYAGWFVRPLDGGYGEYVAAEHLTKLSETDVLQAEVTRLTDQLAVSRQAIEDTRSLMRQQFEQFEAWKANLQAVALQAAEDNDMCRVFDRVMEEVGLEGREREITVRVTFDGYTDITVMATSYEAARDQITDDDVVQTLVDFPYRRHLDWTADEEE